MNTKGFEDLNQATFEGRVRALVAQITYKDGYRLICEWDKEHENTRMYLQVACYRPDSLTGDLDWGHGGKAYLSPHMGNGEIVKTAFALFKSYEEHECREFFKYDGRAVFGPHISVDALWQVANRLEVRS